MSQHYRIHALELGPMENFVYLIEDMETRRAAVVDPAWEIPAVTRLAQEHGLDISDVLLTHSHHDHVNGIVELQQTWDAKVHLLKPEAQFWGEPLVNPALHHGGDRIDLGQTSIELLHTPGHTPGSCCFRIGDDLISGDTLFIFGCGRCDLKGGDPEQMFDTLRRLRSDLPAATRIHPGHNYSVTTESTMQEQIAGNPFLHFHQRQEFVDYRMHRHDRERHSPYGPVPPEQMA